MMNASSFFPIALPACNAGNHLLKIQERGCHQLPRHVEIIAVKGNYRNKMPENIRYHKSVSTNIPIPAAKKPHS